MFTILKSAKISVASRLLLSVAVITTALGWSFVVSSSEFIDSTENNASLTAPDQDLEQLTESIYLGINQYRARKGLTPLSLDAHMSRQAQIHSQNMAQQVVQFSHQGFKGRIRALASQIAYRRAAENVAFNYGYSDPAQTAIDGWIKSQGHHRNMIGNFDLTGIGVARSQQGEYYFTQIFIEEQ